MRIQCTSCQATLNIQDHLAGKRIRCPKCQTVIIVPGGAAGGTFDFSGGAPSAPPPKPKRSALAITLMVMLSFFVCCVGCSGLSEATVYRGYSLFAGLVLGHSEIHDEIRRMGKAEEHPEKWFEHMDEKAPGFRYVLISDVSIQIFFSLLILLLALFILFQKRWAAWMCVFIAIMSMMLYAGMIAYQWIMVKPHLMQSYSTGAQNIPPGIFDARGDVDLVMRYTILSGIYIVLMFFMMISAVIVALIARAKSRPRYG